METRQMFCADYLPGDANQDEVFDSADLVQVFQAGEHEDGKVGNSTWGTGDWNGDREFGSADLVVAFQSAAYGRTDIRSECPQDDPLEVFGDGLVAFHKAFVGPLTTAMDIDLPFVRESLSQLANLQERLEDVVDVRLN
jgi:hypothetical protein